MSCNATFVKSLFGSGKDNCRKCGRVVCKQCLKHKIQDYKVCNECYKNRENRQANEQYIWNLIAPDGTTISPKSQRSKSPSNGNGNGNNDDIAKTKVLYERGMRDISKEKESTNNPYLSENMIKQYERQINMRIPKPMQLNIDRTRSHSADVSTTSTVPVPHSLLDLTTDIPLPTNNVPSPNIIAPLLKEEEEYNEDEEYKLFEIRETSDSPRNSINNNSQRKSIPFRARKPPKKALPGNNNNNNNHNRQTSASVGNIRLSGHSQHSKSSSNGSTSIGSNGMIIKNGAYQIKRKSITVIKWNDDDTFDIDEKAMKLNEDKTYTETKIDKNKPMIIRLDGYGFGMFTNKMEKPFDERFHNAMVYTSCDLLKEFECYTVFTQSDEIVMIYPTTHHKVKGTYLFSGKIAKILSVVSSFASVRLSYHLRKQNWINNMEIQREINNCCVSFNGRCFNLNGNNDDIFDYIIWRLKKNIRGYKKILTVANEFSHGCYIKKEKYMHPRKNKQRERITSCCVQIESKERKYHQLMTEKYWKNSFLQQQQNKANGNGNNNDDDDDDENENDNKDKMDDEKYNDNKKNKNKNKQSKDRLSFDDNDVYPDIYNTMVVHDGNNKNNNIPPPNPSMLAKKQNGPKIPPPNPFQQQIKPNKARPKPKPIPKRPQSSKAATQSHRNNVNVPSNIPNSKYIITPKRKSLPVGKQKDIYSLADRVAAESRKKRKENKSNAPKAYVPPPANIYDTMIIHDIPNVVDNAQTMTVRDVNNNKNNSASSSSKPPIENNNNKAPKKRYSKYATRPSQQQQQTTKPTIKRQSRSPRPPPRPKSPSMSKARPMVPPKPKSRSPQPRIKGKTKSIPKPASANPNYKYDFKIDISTRERNNASISSTGSVSITRRNNNHNDNNNNYNNDNKTRQLHSKSDSPKPMSAKDRIRLMNARLQKIQQQT